MSGKLSEKKKNKFFLKEWIFVALLSILICISAFINVIPGVLITDLSVLTNSSESSISSMFWVKAVGMIISSLILGLFTDLIVSKHNIFLNLKFLFFLATLFGCFYGYFVSFSSNFYISVISNFFGGISWQIYYTLFQVSFFLIWRDKNPKNVAISNNIFQAAYALGCFLCPFYSTIIFSFNLSSQWNVLIIFGPFSVLYFLGILAFLFNSPENFQESPKKRVFLFCEKKNKKNDKETEMKDERDEISHEINIIFENVERKEKKEREFHNNNEIKRRSSMKERFSMIFQTFDKIQIFRVLFDIFMCLSVCFFVGVSITHAVSMFYFVVVSKYDKILASVLSSFVNFCFFFGRFLYIILNLWFPSILLLLVAFLICFLSIIFYIIFLLLCDKVTFAILMFFCCFFCACSISWTSAYYDLSKFFGFRLNGIEISILSFGISFSNFFPSLANVLMDDYGNVMYFYVLLAMVGLSLITFLISCFFGFIHREIHPKFATICDVTLSIIKEELEALKLEENNEISIPDEKKFLLFKKEETIFFVGRSPLFIKNKLKKKYFLGEIIQNGVKSNGFVFSKHVKKINFNLKEI